MRMKYARKLSIFLLCIEAEPTSESGQQGGFTFVQGGLDIQI